MTRARSALRLGLLHAIRVIVLAELGQDCASLDGTARLPRLVGRRSYQFHNAADVKAEVTFVVAAHFRDVDGARRLLSGLEALGPDVAHHQLLRRGGRRRLGEVERDQVQLNRRENRAADDEKDQHRAKRAMLRRGAGAAAVGRNSGGVGIGGAALAG